MTALGYIVATVAVLVLIGLGQRLAEWWETINPEPTRCNICNEKLTDDDMWETCRRCY